MAVVEDDENVDEEFGCYDCSGGFVSLWLSGTRWIWRGKTNMVPKIKEIIAVIFVFLDTLSFRICGLSTSKSLKSFGDFIPLE